ncbi:uncharacterized protein LOC135483123 isoform X2 [Lineus longissimus]|uniref:uncharacterized protein LOC135483123 isoform X2 n=1 Tax=Lineus longissimus TaxID=88925 RepID=UPI00315D4DF2
MDRPPDNWQEYLQAGLHPFSLALSQQSEASGSEAATRERRESNIHQTSERLTESRDRQSVPTDLTSRAHHPGSDAPWRPDDFPSAASWGNPPDPPPVSRAEVTASASTQNPSYRMESTQEPPQKKVKNSEQYGSIYPGSLIQNGSNPPSQGSDGRGLPSFSPASSRKQPALPSFSSMFWPGTAPKTTGLPSFQDFTKTTPEQFQNAPMLPNFAWNMFSPVQDSSRFDTSSPRFSPWGFNGYPLSLTPNSGKSSPAHAPEHPTYLDSSSSASSVSDLRTNVPCDAQPDYSLKKTHKRSKSHSQIPKSSPKSKTVKDFLLDRVDESSKTSSASPPQQGGSEMEHVYQNIAPSLHPDARLYQMPLEPGEIVRDRSRLHDTQMQHTAGLLGVSSSASQAMVPTDLSKYSAEKHNQGNKMSEKDAELKEKSADALAREQQRTSYSSGYSSMVSPPAKSYVAKSVLPCSQLPPHTSSSGDVQVLPPYSESSVTSSRPASTTSFTSLDSNVSVQNPATGKKLQTEEEFRELDRDTERDILRRIFACQSLELCDPKAIASRPKTFTSPETSHLHTKQEMVSPNPKPKKKKKLKKPKEGPPPPAPFMPGQYPLPAGISGEGMTSSGDEPVHSSLAWQPAAVVSPSSAGLTDLSPGSKLPGQISETNTDRTPAWPLNLDSNPSTTSSNGSSENISHSTGSTVQGLISHSNSSASTTSSHSVHKDPPNVISYEHLKNCMTPEQLMLSAYSKDFHARIQKHLLQTRDARIPSDVQAHKTKNSTPSPKEGKPTFGVQGSYDQLSQTSQESSNLQNPSKHSMPGPDFNRQFMEFVGKASPSNSKGKSATGGIHYARNSPHIPKISSDSVALHSQSSDCGVPHSQSSDGVVPRSHTSDGVVPRSQSSDGVVPRSHTSDSAAPHSQSLDSFTTSGMNTSSGQDSLDKLLALSNTIPMAPAESAIAKLDRVISSVDVGDGQQSSHLSRLADFNGSCNSSESAGHSGQRTESQGLHSGQRTESQGLANVLCQPLVSNVSSPKVEQQENGIVQPVYRPKVECPPNRVLIPPLPEVKVEKQDSGTVAPLPQMKIECPPNQVLIPPPPEMNRTPDFKDSAPLNENKLKDPYAFDESPPPVSYPTQQTHYGYPTVLESQQMSGSYPRSNTQPMPVMDGGADAYRMSGAYPPSSNTPLPPQPRMSESGYVNASGSYRMEINTGGNNERMNVKQEDLPPQAQVAFDKNLDLLRRLKTNTQETPHCNCRKEDFNEKDEGPFYTHLGSGRSIPEIREEMERRTGFKGNAIRIEKVLYSGKEGRTTQGCPVAKWIIRRSGPEEKVLVVVRQRAGHFCDATVIIIVIVAWEGVVRNVADDLYNHLIRVLPNYGQETERRCGANEQKTCACQGFDPSLAGASFSFGCSWSMFFNGCKFSRSRCAKKFKLKDESEEEEIERRFQNLATDMAPVYRTFAPQSYSNQCFYEDESNECRLGLKPGRPFSGVTSCVDFCAHAHKDLHNMQNGCTVVVTLTKHRGFEKPKDEQLHVLPLYVLDPTDESGSYEGQNEKIRNGSLEVLTNYYTITRVRGTPKKPKKKNKTGSAKKDDSSPKTPRGRKPKSTTDVNKSVSDQNNMYFDSKTVKEKKQKKEKLEWDEERAVTPMSEPALPFWPGQGMPGMPLMPVQSPNGMMYPYPLPSGYMPHPAFPFPPPFMAMHPWMGMGAYPEQGYPPGRMDQFQQKQKKKPGPKGPRKKKTSAPDVKPGHTQSGMDSKLTVTSDVKPKPEPVERSGSLSSLQEVLDNVHESVRESLSQGPNSPIIGATVRTDPSLGSILNLNTPDFASRTGGEKEQFTDNLQSILDDVHKYVKESLSPSPGSPRGIPPSSHITNSGQNTPSKPQALDSSSTEQASHVFQNGVSQNPGSITGQAIHSSPGLQMKSPPESSDSQHVFVPEGLKPTMPPPNCSESPYAVEACSSLRLSESINTPPPSQGPIRTGEHLLPKISKESFQLNRSTEFTANLATHQLPQFPKDSFSRENTSDLQTNIRMNTSGPEQSVQNTASSLENLQSNSVEDCFRHECSTQNTERIAETAFKTAPTVRPLSLPTECRSELQRSTEDSGSQKELLTAKQDNSRSSPLNDKLSDPLRPGPSLPGEPRQEGNTSTGGSLQQGYTNQGIDVANGQRRSAVMGNFESCVQSVHSPVSNSNGQFLPHHQSMHNKPQATSRENLSQNPSLHNTAIMSGQPSAMIPSTTQSSSADMFQNLDHLQEILDGVHKSVKKSLIERPMSASPKNVSPVPSPLVKEYPHPPIDMDLTSGRTYPSSGMAGRPDVHMPMSMSEPLNRPGQHGNSELSNSAGPPDKSGPLHMSGPNTSGPNISGQRVLSGPPAPYFSSMGMPRPIMSCPSGPPVMKKNTASSQRMSSVDHLDDILSSVHAQVKEFVESSENDMLQSDSDAMQGLHFQSGAMQANHNKSTSAPSSSFHSDKNQPKLNSSAIQPQTADHMHLKLEQMSKFVSGKSKLDPAFSIDALASMFTSDPLKNIENFRNEMLSATGLSAQQSQTLPSYPNEQRGNSGSQFKDDHSPNSFMSRPNVPHPHQNQCEDPSGLVGGENRQNNMQKHLQKNSQDYPCQPDGASLPYPRDVERLRRDNVGDLRKPVAVLTQDGAAFQARSPIAHPNSPSPRTPPHSGITPVMERPRSREQSPDSRFTANSFQMDQFQKFSPLTSSVGPRISADPQGRMHSPVTQSIGSDSGPQHDLMNQFHDKMPNAENIDFFAQMAHTTSGSSFPGSIQPKIPVPHRVASPLGQKRDTNIEKMLPFAMPKLPASLLSPLIPSSPSTPKHNGQGPTSPFTQGPEPLSQPQRRMESPIPMAHAKSPSHAPRSQHSPAFDVIPGLQSYSTPSPAHTPKPAWQGPPGIPQPNIGEVHPSMPRNQGADWPMNLSAEAMDRSRPHDQHSRTASHPNTPLTPHGRPWQEGGADKPLDLSAERPMRHDSVTLFNPFDDYPSPRQAPNKVSYERTPVLEQAHHQEKDYANVRDLQARNDPSEEETLLHHQVRRNDTVFVRNPFDVDMPYPPNTSCPPLSPHSKLNRQEKFAQCSSQDGKGDAPKQDPEFNLHLLSEAVAMRADTPQPHLMQHDGQGLPLNKEHFNHPGQYQAKQSNINYSQGQHGSMPMEQTLYQQPMSNKSSVNSKPGSRNTLQSDFLPMQEPDGCQRDVPLAEPPKPPPDREYISDNEEVFHDKQSGGVAIALSHGAVLFEVAKRELHATTALKNPNRYSPTRISIVFYQHKNLNNRQHGWAEWEAKMEAKMEGRRKEAEERRQELIGQGEVTPDNKGEKGQKRTNDKVEDSEEQEIEPFVPPVYRYMWDTNVKHGTTMTNDTVVTKWKKPQCIISGPYQKWI